MGGGFRGSVGRQDRTGEFNPTSNNGVAREAFLRAAGWTPERGPDRRLPYDRAADLVADSVDLPALDLPA